MMYFIQHVSPKKHCNFVTENFRLKNTQNGQKEMFKSKIMYRYVSSCSALSIKHLKKTENSVMLILWSFDAEI